MNTVETAILSGFWQKNGLGPSGVCLFFQETKLRFYFIGTYVCEEL